MPLNTVFIKTKASSKQVLTWISVESKCSTSLTTGTCPNLTSPKGKAESTCPQNQPKLAQTRRRVHAGTCHYPDPKPGDCRPQRSTTPPAHVTFTPTTRGAPWPPRARLPGPKPRPPPQGPQPRVLPTKTSTNPRAPRPPTTKCTKAAGGEEAAKDNELGDPSHKINPELPTRFPAGTCSSPSGVVRAWSWGERRPSRPPSSLHWARRTPTPWASATIPLAGPRPLGRSNAPGREKKEAPGGESGRTSVRGVRAAAGARALAPFSFQPHRAAEAPVGAEPAEARVLDKDCGPTPSRPTCTAIQSLREATRSPGPITAP
ncbi:uncharacterized protein [Callorhinus ursinus]|uniref:uncharacterized protein n=1 Tax=Callorhinus ursinus TaxID=34884 RepID=UPI003CD002A8